MSENKILRAGITLGDPNGIGPEIVIKAFADPRMSEMLTPVVYGSSRAVAYYRRGIPEAENLTVNVIGTPKEAKPKRFNLVECSGDEIRFEPGTPSAEAASTAVDALLRAADDLERGLIDVLVTAPINKETAYCDRFAYKGHTDFLAGRFGGEPLMMMCGRSMKVGLATVHVPLAEVSSVLSSGLIHRRIVQLRECLKTDFGIVEPRIAVLALNPHAGDGGLIGNEESEIIRPAIEQAWNEHILAFGPFPADGFFAAASYAKYDAVLAMYHDQGLAPFKALCPDGVNYTASLGIVRTSPDHGTAYDIAGRNEADPSSLRQAVWTACDVWRSRRRWAAMTANPLRRYEREKGADVSASDLPQTGDED